VQIIPQLGVCFRALYCLRYKDLRPYER